MIVHRDSPPCRTVARVAGCCPKRPKRFSNDASPYNVQPLKRTVEEKPLAMCDVTSTPRTTCSRWFCASNAPGKST